MRLLVIALVVAVTPAAAQPAPCAECARGDAIIEKFSLQPVRPLAATIAALRLADPVSPEQYAHIVELRQQTPALVRLGAVDEADLPLIAAALCQAANNSCTTATTHALLCLSDRCPVALPIDRGGVDVVTETCDRYKTHKRSPALGLGVDWGNGWHGSRYPNDGRAWSFGVSARHRIGPRLGAVVRVDRVAGRDEAMDLDGNGKDDQSTGSITRVSALAGPSFVFDLARFENASRFLRLDLLAGYVGTRSQPDEHGPAAGIDLAFQLWAIRAGVRFVQGFADARDASTVLVHLGFVTGSAPEYSHGTDCAPEQTDRSSSRLAIGFDVPLGGYGFASQHGYLATGFALEAKWYLSRRFDAVTRADLIAFPGDERDIVYHSAALAGLRIDHRSSKRSRRSERIGTFSTVLAGYTHGAGVTPTSSGSGPITDVSLGWGVQGKEGAGWFALHARFGLSPDNADYRALFLSAGFELRLDSRRWRARI